MYAEIADLRARLGGSVFDEIYPSGGAAQEDLADAASGVFLLPGAAENNSGSAGISMIAGDEPMFTRDKLKGY